MKVLEYQQDTPEGQKRSAAISVKNVLYATDFSAISESALPYATAISRRFGSTLHVAHVLSDSSVLLMTGGVDYVSMGTLYEDAHSTAQEKIQQITTRLGGIPYRTYVRHGQVWANLSSIVAENAIDLIVVGSHGRTGLGKLLLGSVAENILRHSPCPVLTVGPRVAGRAKLQEFHGKGRELAPAELEMQHIVYATNLTPASLTVAPVAIALAKVFQSRLTLMHVIEDYADLEDRPGPIEGGVRQLQAIVPKDASLAYVPEIVMEFGSASECIVKAAAEREADLIVLGARPADGTTHLPWTTVHRVVANATCPVLTVPA
ncbi:MAG: universal stress protein [Candidatus Sulfotelmatobacter sp.]|jgi:nucleotide-binding universal stress UspA family protein